MGPLKSTFRMKTGLLSAFVVLVVPAFFVCTWADGPAGSEDGASVQPQLGEDLGAVATATGEPAGAAHASSVTEARFRARLLHETIRGTLQVMHRDFFDEDNAHAIPSASLEDVFDELARGYQVDVKWLVVDTDVVNVDHRPSNAFEMAAVKALASGKKRFELADQFGSSQQARYRYAGPIRLASQCLKCHVKRRTSNEERVAGLVISMPLKSPSKDDAVQSE